jgi:hypothetical protein
MTKCWPLFALHTHSGTRPAGSELQVRQARSAQTLLSRMV